jgi:uncharacterized protein UPF0137
MSKVNNLLFSRLKQKFSKTSELATASSHGNLSSFAGVFKIQPLSSEEKDGLEHLLDHYKHDAQETQNDLVSLTHLTSEIKAIQAQATLLHGERIKKAQEILKHYRDGAFSSWLIQTYGNRQTPYNFLQYFEFYSQLPPKLALKLGQIPRQAVYTLASRDAPLEEKQALLENYSGETKKELLSLIRQQFPLEESDRRKEDLPTQARQALEGVKQIFLRRNFRPTDEQKLSLRKTLEELLKLI